jgi:ornithine cyclodeaminase/alanine dehydrogenase-like protein (mu-crystallin family)
MTMRMVDAERVHALLDFPGLIEALRRGHLEPAAETHSHLMRDAAAGAAFLALPAWQHGKAMGIKVVTVFPDNPSTPEDVPAVQAVFLLFDAENGRPVACIDGTALTYRKTAADSGLGSAFLARTDAETLLMVGAGGLAPYVIAAHRAARPGLRRVLIWNRTPAKAERLAATIPDAKAVADLEAAARQADIIACATNATSPLILGEWLRPGVHLDLIGSYTPEMCEADIAAVARARVWGDTAAKICERSGEIVAALASGALQREDIVGDLYGLAQGLCPGRQSAEEITLFKNAGGGHLDLMTARHLMERLGQGRA